MCYVPQWFSIFTEESRLLREILLGKENTERIKNALKQDGSKRGVFVVCDLKIKFC